MIRIASCLLLLAGATQAHEETKWALGLHVIDFEPHGIGLWRIGPNRAYGLALLGYDQYNQSDKQFFSARSALTFQDFLAPRGPVKPFWFLQVEGDLELWRHTGEFPTGTRHTYTGTLSVGFGISRKLTKQFRLAVFQGIGAGIGRSDNGDEEIGYWRSLCRHRAS